MNGRPWLLDAFDNAMRARRVSPAYFALDLSLNLNTRVFFLLVENGLKITENGLKITENGFKKTENGLKKTETSRGFKLNTARCVNGATGPSETGNRGWSR